MTGCSGQVDDAVLALEDTISAEGIAHLRTGFDTICRNSLACLEARVNEDEILNGSDAGKEANAACEEVIEDASEELRATLVADYPA